MRPFGGTFGVGGLVRLGSSSTQTAFTYYLANSGDDTKDGLTPATAWKTIAKLNSITLNPGETVGFKKGDLWRETLTVSSSGNSGSPIVFGSYGGGNMPILDGSDIISSWANSWTLSESFHKTGGSNLPGNWGFRNLIPANSLTVNGSSIKITLEAASDSSATVARCYIGEKAATGDAYDFQAGTVHQVLFSGVGNVTIGATSQAVSDELSMSFDKTKNYIVAFDVPSGSVRNAASAGAGYYKSPNTGDAGTENVSGFSAGGTSWYGLHGIDVINTTGGSQANTWVSNCVYEPFNVRFDGNKGVKKTSLVTLAANYDYFWVGGKLYTYISPDVNPTSLYTQITASQRDFCIDDNAKNYVQFVGLHTTLSNKNGIYNDGNNNTINGCLIDHLGGGYVGIGNGHGIYLSGSNVHVLNTEIAYCNQTGITVQGNSAIIEKNTIHHNWNGFTYESNYGQGTGVSINGNNNIIRKNRVYNNFVGIADNGAEDTFIALNYVRNNLVNSIDHWNGVSGHPTKIYNNTVYHNPTFTSGHGIACQVGGDYCIIKNNNLYMGYVGVNVNINGIDLQFANFTNVEIDNNNVFNVAGGTGHPYVIAANKMTTLSAWKEALSASGYGGANEIYSNPLFISDTDFHLQVASPCINAGVDVGLTEDFDGNPIVGLPDIGAFEYIPPPVPSMDLTNLLDLGLSSLDIDSRINYFASFNPLPIGITFDFRGNGAPTIASLDAMNLLVTDNRNIILLD